MNINRKVYFYKPSLPLSLFLLIFLLGSVIFTILAILGLFIGIIIGTVAIGFVLFRLLIPAKKKFKRVEEDGRTINLRQEEYEVLQKKG